MKFDPRTTLLEVVLTLLTLTLYINVEFSKILYDHHLVILKFSSAHVIVKSKKISCNKKSGFEQRGYRA